MDHHLVAVQVEIVQRHLLTVSGLPRTEEVTVVERIGILEFALDRFRRIEILALGLDAVHEVGRPRAQHGLATVHALRAVNQPQRAPRTVVTRAQDRDRQMGLRKRPRIDHAPWAGRVVAPIETVPGSVRIADPKPLRVAEVAVDIFPPVIQDPAVRHQGGVAFEERGFADLPDVRAVGLHAVKIAHDVAVAHAVLGLTRCGEKDIAVRQPNRIDIRNARIRGELPHLRAVRLHRIDMVVVLPALAHGKHDPSRVVADVGIADRRVRAGREQRSDGAAPDVEQLESAFRIIAAGVDLPSLEHCFGIVVVGAVLLARHKQNRLAGQQRI